MGRASLTSLALVVEMSSHRAIFTSFADEVPVLGLSTSYASALKFVRRFLRTHTPVFVVTEHMCVLALHALSGFRHPKIGRVACNADVVWC